MDLLSETAGFAGGRGDVGRAPRSMALPSLLGEPEKVAQRVPLAAWPGFFGRRALERLESMGSTLAKATCEGGGWRPGSRARSKALVERLEARRSGLAGKDARTQRVRQALHRLAGP